MFEEVIPRTSLHRLNISSVTPYRMGFHHAFPDTGVPDPFCGEVTSVAVSLGDVTLSSTGVEFTTERRGRGGRPTERRKRGWEG